MDFYFNIEDGQSRLTVIQEFMEDKFKFNGVGNKDEFERIFGIINNNIRTNDLKFVNNMKWLAMETTLNTMNSRNLEKKKMIGLNLDLTF